MQLNVLRFSKPVLRCLALAAVLAGCQAPVLPVQPSLVPTSQTVSQTGNDTPDRGKRSVIGRVYDENGMPYHGNTVTAKMVDPSQHFANGQPVYVAKIDQGDYGLANLTPPCTFTVTEELPGYQPETLTYTLTVDGPPVVRGPIFNLVKAR